MEQKKCMLHFLSLYKLIYLYTCLLLIVVFSFESEMEGRFLHIDEIEFNSLEESVNDSVFFLGFNTVLMLIS